MMMVLMMMIIIIMALRTDNWAWLPAWLDDLLAMTVAASVYAVGVWSSGVPSDVPARKQPQGGETVLIAIKIAFMTVPLKAAHWY